MEVILAAIILAILWHSYQMYKQRMANKQLNELYMKRFGEEERVERLKKEKPENIIFVSEIWASEMSLRYIGSFDNLDKVQAENGDFVSKNQREYLYKDGKWYEVVNDIPRIDYNYRMRY